MSEVVTNQPPPLADYDALATDPALVDAVSRLGSDRVASSLTGLAHRVGDPQAQRWAVEANAYPPVLRTHDRYGHRIDEVDHHPSWHELLGVAVGERLHAAAWADPSPHRHLRRAAGFYLWSQVEAGHGCPVSMTYSVLPALRRSPALAETFEPGLTSTTYAPGLTAPTVKAGLLVGMGMTEKQGGSDVRANLTTAVPAAEGGYRLTGHKWFCSAPMSDLFLVLAQLEGELTCFCVPRVLPDGTRNVFRLQRLKDKLGNRSNASSEVELDRTVAHLVGEPGRGIPTILDMVTMTRLDCVLGSASGQRAALVQAIHHTRHRRAFGALLIDQPLMQSVLADLALEVEAATTLAMRLAAAVDRGERDLLRVALPAAKFWVCKRSPVVVGEAPECLGGNGYVEESGLPRLFRESPLNSIWEGSGNVICLDVLQALRNEASVHALLTELDLAGGGDPRYDQALGRLRGGLAHAEPATARHLAASITVLMQASSLIRFAPPEVTDVFCAARLGGTWGPVLGSVDTPIRAARQLVDRAFDPG